MSRNREAKGFRKLIVWQRAHELTLMVYRMSENFPKHEIYGVTSQLRRSSSSVPANIAEGYALGSNAQFLRHLRIAQGSLAEVEYFLILALDLEYYSKDDDDKVESLRSEVGYLLSRLIKSSENKR
jgi:four helix bundle protein